MNGGNIFERTNSLIHAAQIICCVPVSLCRKQIPKGQTAQGKRQIVAFTLNIAQWRHCYLCCCIPCIPSMVTLVHTFLYVFNNLQILLQHKRRQWNQYYFVQAFGSFCYLKDSNPIYPFPIQVSAINIISAYFLILTHKFAW